MSGTISRRLLTGDSLTIGRRACVNWVLVIYFLSGACSLIDQVVWVRLLRLTLGNTVYATSIVVSVFMGGLALGALVMSRYADGVRNHLRLYAALETLITIAAVSLPWALSVVDSFYVWFFRSFEPAKPQLLAVQVVLSAVILLVPSMLMGSTLPLLGRFVTAMEQEVGHLVGRLYALNTLGAAVGCFAAGFVLIRALGVMGALYAAAVLNLIVAFGGWFLSRSVVIQGEQKAQPPATPTARPVSTTQPKVGFSLLIVAFFMSGFVSIGYELLWMRSVIFLLGGVTYVFSAVLTVYLLGNVIGAGIGSRLAGRIKSPAAGFAVTLSLLGLWGVFHLRWLLWWTSDVFPLVNDWLAAVYAALPVSPVTLEPMLHSLFLFLIPSILMGVGFPIALQAWTDHVHQVGRSTGAAYGANTLGAVVGGLVTGFVLVPFVGVQLSLSVLGLMAVWIAGGLCVGLVGQTRIVRRWALVGMAAAVTAFAFVLPPNLFDTVVATSPRIPGSFTLLSVREGLTTTVSVHQDSTNQTLHLFSSGQSIAGDNYALRGDQKGLGHLGVLLNRHADEVLSVGFGSGETTLCLSLHRLKRVDCVEIAQEVVGSAVEFFTHINLGDRLDDEVNMIFMDAKNYLHLTDTRYDAIVNDSIHPRNFAENASLYTREYLEAAKRHLNENGIIISWLPTYQMPASVFDSIIGTHMEVFPHVTLWYLTTNPAPLVFVVASDLEQLYSPRHIDNALHRDGVLESLEAIYIRNSIDLMSCYIGDERDLRQVVTSYSVNSDYSPFVEFTTDEVTPIIEMFRRFVMGVRADSVYDHLDWTGFSDQEKEQWLRRYQTL
ncbi:MAG: fused MFS/spermidine synthase, partial [Phycisphaeraceae bacterium]